jgi:hypothetical protein
MNRALLSVIPGIGHLLHGRPQRAALLGVTWVAFLAVLRANTVGALGAFAGRAVDVKVATVFLLFVLAGLPVLSAWDCRRLRRSGGVRNREGEGQWKPVYRRFMRNHTARTGFFLVLALYCVALLAPFLAPYNPDAQDDIVRTRYLPPGQEHRLGTDKFGRDVLSRIIYGSRISLSIGFIAVGIAVTLGTALGAISSTVAGTSFSPTCFAARYRRSP